MKTVSEFLLHNTQVGELCVIRDQGWVVATVWIDSEDLFAGYLGEAVRGWTVQSDSWGTIGVYDKNGQQTRIPCHYIDC